MGLFGTLMNKIFHAAGNAEKPADAATPGQIARQQSGQAPGTAGGQSWQGGSATATQVDVAAMLDKLADGRKDKIDWKHSIVDLMKLVDMDSSLAARKELAEDLNYTGNKDDSAAMNIWLHQQVMAKLAENGGKLPADLDNR